MLGARIVFVMGMTVTPGPNNVIAIASGANFGVRRSLPFLGGVIAGFLPMLAILCAGAGALIVSSPNAMLALKVAGTLYLLWLAWRIAAARPDGSEEAKASRPLGFVEATLIQGLNPKGWTMALVIVANYSGITTDPIAFALVALMVCAILMSAAILLWIWVGATVGRLGRHYIRPINLTMAALLVVSVALSWAV